MSGNEIYFYIYTGFCKNHVTINRGERLHTASAYIRPSMKRKNLHIALYSHVIKVDMSFTPVIVYMMEKDKEQLYSINTKPIIC